MASYLCADLHLGHRNIPKYRGYESLEQHDDLVCENWINTVRSNKRDTTYVLGDIAFSEEGWRRFDDLPGRKIVILGNHCTEYSNAAFIASLKTVNSVHSMYKHKGCIMSHAPLHPDHLRGKRNLHGHLHSHFVQDRRFFNCSLEQIDMRPIPMEEVFEEFERRQSLLYVKRKLGIKAAVRAVMNG
uniref:Hydrolase n=1 Tax=Pseudomonas phage HRDY3 TaxID=3236930 RepID=A0AB39CEL6_9VIRU